MKTVFSLLLVFFFLTINAQQTFQNVAPAMGITGMTGLGHAVGWGDIDGDGDPDLGISNQEGDGFCFSATTVTTLPTSPLRQDLAG